MQPLVWALIVAASIPYALTLATKWRNFSGRDNHHARQWQAELDGWRKRAFWAHQNAFESFPLFAAAVLVNMVQCPNCNGGCATVALAWGFVASRIAYSLAYIFDRAFVRSILWFVAMGCVAAMMLQAAIGCCRV